MEEQFTHSDTSPQLSVAFVTVSFKWRNHHLLNHSSLANLILRGKIAITWPDTKRCEVTEVRWQPRAGVKEKQIGSPQVEGRSRVLAVKLKASRAAILSHFAPSLQLPSIYGLVLPLGSPFLSFFPTSNALYSLRLFIDSRFPFPFILSHFEPSLQLPSIYRLPSPSLFRFPFIRPCSEPACDVAWLGEWRGSFISSSSISSSSSSSSAVLRCLVNLLTSCWSKLLFRKLFALFRLDIRSNVTKICWNRASIVHVKPCFTRLCYTEMSLHANLMKEDNRTSGEQLVDRSEQRRASRTETENASKIHNKMN